MAKVQVSRDGDVCELVISAPPLNLFVIRPARSCARPRRPGDTGAKTVVDLFC